MKITIRDTVFGKSIVSDVEFLHVIMSMAGVALLDKSAMTGRVENSIRGEELNEA